MRSLGRRQRQLVSEDGATATDEKGWLRDQLLEKLGENENSSSELVVLLSTSAISNNNSFRRTPLPWPRRRVGPGIT